MTLSSIVRPLIAVLFLASSACSGDDDGTTDDKTVPDPTTGDTATAGDDDDDDVVGDDDDDDTTAGLQLVSTPSVHVPSVLHLTGTAPSGAVRVVATATSDGGHTFTAEATVDAGPSFMVPLSGLIYETDYDVQVEVFDGTDASLATDVLSLTSPDAPPFFPGIQGQIIGEAIAAEYVAFALIENDVTAYVVIVDAQGRVVWWKQAEPGQAILTPVLSRDGDALLWGEYDADRGGDTGEWVRVELDGTGITRRAIPRGHHAAVEMPDGGVAWLGLDWRTVDNTDGESNHMAADTIFEGPATYDPNLVEVFNTFDDHGGPPAFTCEHMTDPFERFGESGLEWTHGNSLVYVDSEDAFYLNAKTTDWLLKIDRSTGNLLWQLGGFGSDFTFTDGSPTFVSADDPVLVSHAHMSEAWEGGMVIFDNGDHRTPLISSVAEYAWDETQMTVDRVWSFDHPGSGNTYALGDIKKLSDGSYLVGWGTLSELMVVTSDHRVTWHVTIPSRYIVGRVLALEHL